MRPTPTRRCLPIAFALLACAHPVVEPAPAASRCHDAEPLAALEAPWVPLSTDGMDSGKAGFVRLLRFATDDGAAIGRASVVRLANPETGDSLYRGEKRTWLLHADVSEPRDRVMAYAYDQSDRASDIWIVRSGASHSVRHKGPRPGDDITAWACEVLLESGLAKTIRFREQRDGMATRKDIRRRILGIRSGRGPLDVDRLIKGR